MLCVQCLQLFSANERKVNLRFKHSSLEKISVVNIGCSCLGFFSLSLLKDVKTPLILVSRDNEHCSLSREGTGVNLQG